MRVQLRTVVTLVISFCVGSISYAQEPATLETVATFPSTGFTENLFQTSDGSLYVTAAFDGVLWKVSPDGTAEKFASFPDHATILGIVGVEGGFVLGAHRRGFQTPSGMDFSDLGSEVLMLDNSGDVTAIIPGNDGDVYNGMTLDGYGTILITDSLKSSVWRFDPQTQERSLWVEDDVLSSPSVAELGANGIKVVNGWAYVGNRSKRAVYKIRIDENGDAQGSFSLVADDLPVADDFAVGPDGTVYMPPAEYGAPLIRILPSGEVDTTFLPSGPFGTSAIISNDGKWLYWATSFEPDDQRLVRVAIP